MKTNQLLIIAASIAVTAGLGWYGMRRVSAAPDDQKVLPEIPASATPSASAPKEPSVLVINSNTQATLDDLKLAAFNFRDETYRDEAGVEKQGRTCALHIFVRDDDSKDQKLRVHKGQKLTASGKSFEILEVAASTVRISVK